MSDPVYDQREDSYTRWAELQKQVAQAKVETARAERVAQLKIERGALRDQFATAALTGLLAAHPHAPVTDFDIVARRAYRVADEMLKARDG